MDFVISAIVMSLKGTKTELRMVVKADTEQQARERFSAEMQQKVWPVESVTVTDIRPVLEVSHARLPEV